MATIKDTKSMIAGMTPTVGPVQYVFVHSDDPSHATQAIASFSEAEGMSLILPLDMAQSNGFDCSLPMACITLSIYSALDGVGLTAAVATVLAEAGIACNMVSAYHHDHAFVPAAQVEEAMELLQSSSKAQV